MAFTVTNIPASGVSTCGINLVASNTITSTTTGTGTLNVLDCFSVAFLQAKVTAASGTSPTLDIYIQSQLPDGSTYDDLVHFGQFTTTGSKVATVVAGNQGAHNQATRTLAAATVQTMTLGAIWQIDCVVAGTSPSFTWELWGNFFV